MKRHAQTSLNMYQDTHRKILAWGKANGLKAYEVVDLMWQAFESAGAPSQPPRLTGSAALDIISQLIASPRTDDPNPLVRAASWQARSLVEIIESEDFPKSEQTSVI